MRSNYSIAGLIGSNVVDIVDYNQEVHDYLLSRGAIPYKGSLPIGILNNHFENLMFENQKPVRFHSHNIKPGARIFFTTSDDALLFSVVFGHKIYNSHVKEISNLLNNQNE